jgi:hypothetical protein
MWSVGLATLILALAAPGAVAAPRLVDVGVTNGEVFADGDMAAFQGESGSVHVYTPGRWRMLQPPPRACEGPTPRLVAAGGGLLLFDTSCEERTLIGSIVDVATGRVRTTVPIESQGERGRDAFGDVGRHWVRVHYGGYHWHDVRYVDWRTGAVEGDDAWRPHSYPDLDRRDLFAPVCRPLRRPQNQSTDSYVHGPRYLDYQQRGGWGVARWKDSYSPGHDRWTSKLQRCGSERPLLKVLGAPMLGRGIAVWVAERGKPVALRLRDRRRFVWRPYAWVAGVAGRRVFVAKPLGGDRSRVFTALIPR